jgi:hypothetical protein
MLQPRREFVISASLMFAGMGSNAGAVPGQSRHKSLPDPPTPGDPTQRDKMADRGNPQGRNKMSYENANRIFAPGWKSFQLTSVLREELKTTTTTDVLNVKMYKRLQEVEKLAKQLESEAKG